MDAADFARHASLLARSVKNKEDLEAALLDWFKLAMREAEKQALERQREGITKEPEKQKEDELSY